MIVAGAKSKTARGIRSVLALCVIALLVACAREAAPPAPSPPAKPHPKVAADAVYRWLEILQRPNGLLLSSDASNMVSLYENGLAVICFARHGDFRRAERVLDFFDARLKREMLYKPGGFSQFRDRDGDPGEPHRWLGDNAWLLIAIRNYHELAGNRKYARMEKALERWIRAQSDPRDGGVFGGYEANGFRIGKNTEGIIDAFNAVPGYDGFHRGILRYLRQERWDPQERVFLSGLMDPLHRVAIDYYSWGYCAIPGLPRSYLDGADDFVMTQKATATAATVTGFCFDRDLDCIWFEATGQMAVAYTSAGRTDSAAFYLDQLERVLTPCRGDTAAWAPPYASTHGTHFGTNGLWDGVDVKPSLASAAWYLLGKWGFDPMAVGRRKEIPAADRFWEDGGGS